MTVPLFLQDKRIIKVVLTWMFWNVIADHMYFAIIGDCSANKYNWFFLVIIFSYSLFPGKEQLYCSILTLVLTEYFLFKEKTEIFSELLHILWWLDLKTYIDQGCPYPAQVLIWWPVSTIIAKSTSNACRGDPGQEDREGWQSHTLRMLYANCLAALFLWYLL